MVAMTTRETREGTTMKAVLRERYGPAELLRLGEVDKPELADDGVLVRVRAVSVNRADWYSMMGRPYFGRAMMGGLLRPKSPLLGTDFAGIVEAVGKDVTGLEPGDEVFGARTGAYAEYVCARMVESKPANVTFDEAAAVPVAAITALQALRDHAQLQPGRTVLVNGASGGVGTFAVQIAKALGAGEVTAVCSPRNVEQARALGADVVVDYTKDDYTRRRRRYDVVFDNAGTKSWSANRRVLSPGGTLVLVGGPLKNPLLGPLPRIGRVWLGSRLGSRKAVFFIAKFNKPDMAVLRDLLAAGKIRPVVERRYPFGEIAEALEYVGEGHARGKIVVTM
jgi:NADPH:quinone reductase-like Zn-dependent oxidoreductase